MSEMHEISEVEAKELPKLIGEIVKIHGAIAKIRKMSGFAFVLLRTKREVLQCIYSEAEAGFLLSELSENSCVVFTGKVVKEERSRIGYELHLLGVEILSKPAEEMPVVINNKEIAASLETILNYRPITLRNEKERAVFKLQEGLCIGFRRFLQENQFTEIHSPKIVFAGAEGGANIFKLDYFGKEVFLAQSPQFYKQMMVGVYERVYEMGAVYRAEKHDTNRHLNEYTGVDFEMGYIRDFRELMEMETKMIQFTLEYVKENYSFECELLKIQFPDVEKGIPSLTFKEAKEMVAREYHRETKEVHDFEPEEEKLLCELMKKKTGSEFVFVTHYPSKKRPFYAMDDPEDPEVTLSFDLMFRGIEVTTGGQRIHDYHVQVEKMRNRGMEIESFESYLMAHKYCLPPHGGLGMGLERFTMSLLGKNNVRYASLFPRDIHRVTP